MQARGDAAPGVAWSASAAAGGGGGLCRLRSAAGEPKKFCKRGDWVSYWRVDLRDADDDDDGLDGWLDVDVGPSGGARRALVRGRQLIDSATGAALRLHGVNIYVDYMRFDDMGLLSHLLPQANLVRLVGVFWHDDDACACCTDDAARGCAAAPFQPRRAPATLSPPHSRARRRYFAPSCLAALRAAVRTVTDRGVWVIVAAKARIAAGDRWASGAPDVFSDATLARKYRALWAFLARELRDEPFVAGVEVMPEPRNKASRDPGSHTPYPPYRSCPSRGTRR